MKILYVDMLHDYGDKNRGFNVIGQDGFISSMKFLGHDVDTFYYDNFLSKPDELQVELKRQADIIQPDLIFFNLFTDQFSLETLDYLADRYKTINWFGDDQWRFENFTAHYAKHFSYVITTDKFAIDKYRQLGCQNIIYSQWAAIDSHKLGEFGEYKYDVSFVGSFHPYRKWFIDELKKSGINVVAFGNGWPSGPLSSDDMNKLFFESKINLNLSNSRCFDIRYILTHLEGIKSLIRGGKTASQIKARNFEIPHFGGFQLTDFVPFLGDYFDIGQEVICYKDVDEAAILIKYYLQNDTERESIRDNGIKRAREQHGYIHRLERILEQIDC